MKENMKEMFKDLCHAPTGGVKEDFTIGVLSDSHTDLFIRTIAGHLIAHGWHKQIDAQWIAKDNFDGRCSIATCSNCGTEKAFSILVKTETIAELYPYCQKCGASMKGGAG